MIALRLVHLIESHSDELAAGLQKKFQTSPHTRDLQKVPAHELRDRSYDVYCNLSGWLLNAKESEIESCYREIGARRAAQDVSLSDLCWAIMLTKEHLWDFLEEQGFLKSTMELLGELELLRLLDRFFDRAIYYATDGYMHAQVSRVA